MSGQGVGDEEGGGECLAARGSPCSPWLARPTEQGEPIPQEWTIIREEDRAVADLAEEL